MQTRHFVRRRLTQIPPFLFDRVPVRAKPLKTGTLRVKLDIFDL
jgi:hypothetical protein